jgi:spermidine/putrescine transport system permease protein
MKRWFSLPYLVWMVIFITVPLLLILFYAVTERTDQGLVFTANHFKQIFDPLYLKVFLRSFRIAFIATLICLALGYPVALFLASKDFPNSSTYLLLFVIPMWMNFLLRTYAWLTLLENNGIINQALELLGISKVQFLYNEGAVILGTVYNFLPFMVLPVYSVIVKIDESVIRAAQDLGANNIQVLLKVIVPLSLPGVISGITMVFMPSVSTFVISRLLGGGQFPLIGNIIEQQFLLTSNWGFGSALSFVLLVLVIISMFFTNMNNKDGKESIL